jgi:hypothetical protein
MSEQNVNVVRALFEVWNARDMDAVRDLYDPDVIVRGLEGWPEPGPFVGREAVMRQWKLQRETWDADELELINHSVDVGDRIAVRFIWRGVATGPSRIWRCRPSTRCAMAGSSVRSTSGTTRRPSKPWDCQSRRSDAALLQCAKTSSRYS